MKYIEWDEPWPGLMEDGTECVTNRRIRMTDCDAIRLARAVYKQVRPDKPLPTDQRLLDDFIVVHWAEVKEVKPDGVSGD